MLFLFLHEHLFIRKVFGNVKHFSRSSRLFSNSLYCSSYFRLCVSIIWVTHHKSTQTNLIYRDIELAEFKLSGKCVPQILYWNAWAETFFRVVENSTNKRSSRRGSAVWHTKIVSSQRNIVIWNASPRNTWVTYYWANVNFEWKTSSVSCYV